ncbi:hypothetical protein OIU76_000447 [Salix suchowensis]|nr:hypothetical protein OIU76_000447 [Salix suchowensis]
MTVILLSPSQCIKHNRANLHHGLCNKLLRYYTCVELKCNLIKGLQKEITIIFCEITTKTTGTGAAKALASSY